MSSCDCTCTITGLKSIKLKHCFAWWWLQEPLACTLDVAITILACIHACIHTTTRMHESINAAKPRPSCGLPKIYVIQWACAQSRHVPCRLNTLSSTWVSLPCVHWACMLFHMQDIAIAVVLHGGTHFLAWVVSRRLSLKCRYAYMYAPNWAVVAQELKHLPKHTTAAAPVLWP